MDVPSWIATARGEEIAAFCGEGDVCPGLGSGVEATRLWCSEPNFLRLGRSLGPGLQGLGLRLGLGLGLGQGRGLGLGLGLGFGLELGPGPGLGLGVGRELRS